MTNKEAIERIESISNIYKGLPYTADDREALRLAVMALKEYDQNGCEGCKYEDTDMYVLPCLICKYAHGNMYVRGEEDDSD